MSTTRSRTTTTTTAAPTTAVAAVAAAAPKRTKASSSSSSSRSRSSSKRPAALGGKEESQDGFTQKSLLAFLPSAGGLGVEVPAELVTVLPSVSPPPPPLLTERRLVTAFGGVVVAPFPPTRRASKKAKLPTPEKPARPEKVPKGSTGLETRTVRPRRACTQKVSKADASPFALRPECQEDTLTAMGVTVPGYTFAPFVCGPPDLMALAKQWADLSGDVNEYEDALATLNAAAHQKGRLRVRVQKSSYVVGEWGLMVGDEVIKAGEPVCTYGGELTTKSASNKLPKKERDCQVQVFDAHNLPPLDEGDRRRTKKAPVVIIDGKYVGNSGRFANASHNPNCMLVVQSMRGCVTPYLVALKDIAPGEEITWDYCSGDFFDSCLCERCIDDNKTDLRKWKKKRTT
eukprot:gnl/Hemi2/22646_TR7557_c0_g1_i1.p1 gnl/Hemi2/22646_TR7557_c0_g1~~gnl/Hemi2/22646_TR7557_c0_g1_i1.p1  ORF type:complete len:402 (+),score=101.71 gnl/Hemi2/22646_TR7557_c0_g1_i1:2-1207(+)